MATFHDAMIAAGLSPPEHIPPGKFIRFPGMGKGRSNRAAFCKLFPDGEGGVFGDFSSDLSETWRANGKPQDPEAFIRHMRETQAEAERARKDEQARAARDCLEVWVKANPPPEDHAYLLAKGIKPHGIRCYEGTLLIPMRIGQEIHSLQRIHPGGEKRFWPGGRVDGTYFAIRGEGKTLCVCEGFATGASIHEATGLPVAVAFTAGNLEAVAKAMAEKFSVIVCADNDATEGNPGVTKATEAAQAAGGKIAIPPEEMDFNDLAQEKGLEAVRAVVDAASEPAMTGGEEPWPELIPLDRHDLPSLDLRHLPSWAGDFATALSEATETPPELAAGMVLASISTATQRRLRTQVRDDYSEPCNLWIATILAPGNRKSEVQGRAAAPLLAWEIDRGEEMESEIREIASERANMEARIKKLRGKYAGCDDPSERSLLSDEIKELEATLPEVPVPPQLWTSDATPEGLGDVLATHGERWAWLSSEGGIFDLLKGRYSGGVLNLDLVLKTHSGDSDRSHRIGRSTVDLKNPLMSIGLSPQPEVIRGLASQPAFRGRGLLGRFLYFMPPSPLGYRTDQTTPVPEGIRSQYAAGLHAMLEWPDGSHAARLSEGAYSIWQEFWRLNEAQMRPDGMFEYMTDWAGKAPGAAARIAGNLHAIIHAHGSPWAAEIAPETMEAALELIAVAAKHSIAALGLMGADPALEAALRLWDWIENRRLSHFKATKAFDSLRKGKHFPRMDDLMAAMEVLEERGYVEIIAPEPTGRRGRKPSPTVVVRPDIAEGWR